MEYLLFGARCALAVTLAASAIGKLRAPGDFRRAVRDMDVVPDRLAGPVAGLVLAAETALILLVWLPGRLGAAAFAAAALLLAAFTAVLVVLIRRGSDASCACFGQSRTPVGAAHVVRNAALLTIAGLGAVAAAGGSGTALPPELPAALAAALAAVVTSALLISTDTLVGLFARPS
ncbi:MULTISPECIES: MauE/DoxX family redox-associated membrane protein [unclassified Streptomyces]|uniref:MauE/DoxX family redox-associated membrane protein n=1 Tax=unclassified Streptomyces TaxID=2593676 RepID=UPI00332788AA